MKKLLLTLAALPIAALPIAFTAPAHADCTLHCPVPSLPDLEQRTCYVLDKDGALTPDGKLTTAYAMSLKFDLSLDEATNVVSKSIADYCPWHK
jgi:hypothetical protein